MGSTPSLQPSQPALLNFQANITGSLTCPATFTANPTISAGWNAQIVGPQSLLVPAPQQPGPFLPQTWPLTVQVTPPAGSGTTTAALVVTVSSTNPAAQGANPSLSLTSPGSVPNADNRVVLAPYNPPTAPYKIYAGPSATVTFGITINSTGAFTMSFPNTPAGWSTPSPIALNPASPHVPVTWSLPASWGPGSTATISVEVKSSDGGGFDQTWTFPAIGF
jgi:hypothetical protein